MNIEMKQKKIAEMKVMGKEKRSASKLIAVLTMLAGFLLGATAQAAQTVTYYHADAAGTAVAASDESGSLLWRKSYDPYGDKRTDGEGDSNAIAYTGKKHDDVTGLTYMGARYYDPEVGRFMGMDAVGFQDDSPITFNRYAYANNNPYKYKDPDGNIVFLIPVVMFIAKEIAGEVFERTTGIPAVFTVKGAAKAGLKLLKSLGKKKGWNGPADYSSVKDPKNLVNTKPTPRQVREMKELNRQHNGGVLRSDLDGTKLVDAKKSMKGVTPAKNEVQVDHINPVNKGGTRTNSNLQLLGRKQNRDKSDK